MSFFGNIKNVIKMVVAACVYDLYGYGIIKSKKIKVMSIDDTIRLMQSTNKSLVRFGDGEVTILRGTDIAFQESDSALSTEMAEILGYHYDDLVVCIVDMFNDIDQYVPKTKKYWKEHLLIYRKYYNKLCDPNRTYGNSFFSRCYMNIRDKDKSAIRFEEIKKIWAGKEVVVVEGCGTHNGVGNDLLDACKNINRIICPSTNAYDRKKEILDECYKMDKSKLFLVSLGPAAKTIVNELFQHGYRAIDIGQVDTEYEWFLRGVTQKEKLIKHSIVTKADNQKMGYKDYLTQIVAWI